MNRGAFVLSVAGAATVPVAGVAQTVTTAAAIARLFTAPAIQSGWFSPVFLAAVPLEKVRVIVAGVVATLGAYQGLAPNGGGYTLTFERGTIQAEAALDGDGAFSGLLLSRMQSAAATERLNAIFQTGRVPAEWFSDRMLAAVPIDKIAAIVSAMKTQYGALRSVTPAKDGTYDVAFANGESSALIYLGSDGKIEGLIFRPLAGKAAE
jgi:hypothetical protein